MDVQLIECKLIDVPKHIEIRTFKKDFAIRMADSIRVEGLRHAITVRPSPAVAGRYTLVAGRHRLYAIGTVLKEQFIECDVVVDMDDMDAEMATLSENLWRNPLTKAQHAQSIKLWFAHYTRHFPEQAKGEQGREAMRKIRDAKAAAAVDPENETASDAPIEFDAAHEVETDEPAPAKRTAATFSETVSRTTGMTPKSVQRAMRLAKNFTKDQLECFDQMSTSQTDMTTIARIKDESKRAEVVNLIAAGMEANAALKEVMKDAAPAKSGAFGAEVQKEKDEAAAVKAPDLSDDEWYELYCGEKGACFAGDSYRRDAIAYRKYLDARHTFRVKVKSLIKSELAKPGRRPVAINLINRVISLAHPKDWLICETCKGTTQHLGATCQGCYGAGYKVKLEEYV